MTSSATVATGRESFDERARVESFLIAPDRRVPVINGKRAQEGDQLERAAVKAIRAFGVAIETSDGLKMLELDPNYARQRPSSRAGAKHSIAIGNPT